MYTEYSLNYIYSLNKDILTLINSFSYLDTLNNVIIIIII
jgi:hypothetical protein